MKDERYQELIDAVQGGNATEEQVRKYRSLIESDAEFRAHAEFLESLRSTARKSNLTVSSDFASRVAAAARSTPRSSRIEDFHNRKTTIKSLFVDFVPKSRGFVIAVAVHACILLILAFVFLAPKGDNCNTDVISLVGAPKDIAQQRATAPQFACNIDADGGIDVSSLSVKSTLYILRSSESRMHVLLAYTAEQIEKIDPTLKDQAFPARIVDGRIRLSIELIETGLALRTNEQVMVVALSDRIEIWNKGDFDGYIRSVPTLVAGRV